MGGKVLGLGVKLGKVRTLGLHTRFEGTVLAVEVVALRVEGLTFFAVVLVELLRLAAHFFFELADGHVGFLERLTGLAKVFDVRGMLAIKGSEFGV